MVLCACALCSTSYTYSMKLSVSMYSVRNSLQPLTHSQSCKPAWKTQSLLTFHVCSPPLPPPPPSPPPPPAPPPPPPPAPSATPQRCAKFPKEVKLQELAGKLCEALAPSREQGKEEGTEERGLKAVFELLPPQSRKMVLLKLAGRRHFLSSPNYSYSSHPPPPPRFPPPLLPPPPPLHRGGM